MRLLVLLGLAALALPAAAAAPQEDWMVHVNKAGDTFTYLPARIEVYPGAPIQLMVFGSPSHTMTSPEGAWPEAVTGPDGLADFRAPMAPGEYRFYCRNHASPDDDPARAMTGVLIVTAREAAADASAAPPPEAEQAATPAAGALLAGVALVAAAVARRR